MINKDFEKLHFVEALILFFIVFIVFYISCYLQCSDYSIHFWRQLIISLLFFNIFIDLTIYGDYYSPQFYVQSNLSIL